MAGTFSVDLITLENMEGAAPTIVEYTNFDNGGGNTPQDPDYFIQGLQCTTRIPVTNTKQGAYVSLVVDTGAGQTIPTGDSIFIWSTYQANTAISNLEQFTTSNSDEAGFSLGLSNLGLTDFTSWAVGGKNVGSYPYGGWQNFVVYPTNTNSNIVDGSGLTTPTSIRYFGIICHVDTAISRGYLFAMDAIRHGRGTTTVTGGSVDTVTTNRYTLNSNAANFLQMADYDEYNEGATPSFGSAVDGGYHKFGLFTSAFGSFLYKGRMEIGTATTSCYFDDANRTININDCWATYDGFNEIVIDNASTEVYWDAINLNSLSISGQVDSTYIRLSPCDFTITNATAVELSGCNFTDMGEFVMGSMLTANNCVWRRTRNVNADGGSYTNCQFISLGSSHSNASKYSFIVNGTSEWNSLVSSCNFVHNGRTNNACITISSPGSYTFDDITFEDINNASNLYAIEYTGAGGSLTIGLQGTSTLISASDILNTGAATISITQNKTFTISNIQPNSEIRIIRETDGAEYAGLEDVGAVGGGNVDQNTNPRKNTLNIGSSIVASDDPNNSGRRRVVYSFDGADTTSFGSSPNFTRFEIKALSLEYLFLKFSTTFESESGSQSIDQQIDRNYRNL